MRPTLPIAVTALGSLLGLGFASVATYDFVAHLDRQTHDMHCSFLPGLTGTEESGSGCHATLLSPWSSFYRDSVWGGIPISLPAMSVFAFIAAFTLWLVVAGRQQDRRAAGFLLLAAFVPALASVVMGYLSFVELGAACKLCIGVYTASALVLVGALWAFLRAGRGERVVLGTAHDIDIAVAKAEPADTARDDDVAIAARQRRSALATRSPVSWGVLAAAAALGIVFVAVPVVGYASRAPDFSEYLGSCGELPAPADARGVLVPIGPQRRGVQLVEVLDPLCAHCRAFEQRIEGIEMEQPVSRRALLFPLDDSCNWMVDRAIHPGACAVSEAMLCAGDDAEDVLHWSFTEQERIMAAERERRGAAARMVIARFPRLRGCIGAPATATRLNHALRWAVDNQLPVVTPQLFVGNQRLCDEDTDLGMDWALPRLVAQAPIEDPPRPGRVRDAGPARASLPRSARDEEPTPTSALRPAQSPVPEPVPEPVPDSVPDPAPEPAPAPAPDPAQAPTPDPAPAPAPEAAPLPDIQAPPTEGSL